MSVFTRKKEISITEGKLLGNMIRYAIPIMFTNVLQLFYNSADMYVLGNFCSDGNAFGSVGCTTALINMILGLFIGLGAGVCVTLSHSIGAGDDEKSSKIVHTSFVMAIIFGIVVGVVGFFAAKPLLLIMRTPDEFVSGATLYVKIYFCGSVANLMYNFSAGILRSRGDTVRPLLFSSIGGVVNIILNVIFVRYFDMGVEGVAIATVISQVISATITVIHMTKLNDACRLCFSKLCLDRKVFVQFIKIGLPAGIQGSLFSISNMLLQSGYNSLGTVAVNANTAASNVDGYIYNILNSFYHVTLTFASQNFGAGKYDRLKKVMFLSSACVVAIGVFLGVCSYMFSDLFLGIFNSDKEVLNMGRYRLMVVGLPYFLCGLMEIGTAMLRSIGYSFYSLVITFAGSCFLRIVWVYTVFAAYRNLTALYMAYPVSWFVTTVILFAVYAICYKHKIKSKNEKVLV